MQDTHRTPKDMARIDVKDDTQLQYWSRELGVAPKTLKDAVKRAGNISVDVRRQLRRHPRGLELRGR